MDLNLQGKIAVVTGGSEGIGYATAMEFCKEGCKVAICSRSESKLAKAKAEFKEAGFDLYTKSVDVSDPVALESFLDDVHRDFGRIDILVNNAAYTIVKSIQEISLDEWKSVYDCNLHATFVGIKVAGKYMKEDGGGNIINLGSFGGIMPPMYRSAYCTTKHAIDWLTRCAAAEYGPFNIRVNQVAPGSINTAMQAAAGRTQADVERVAQNFALHRPGEPEEVASVIAFLASDQSSYCDGISIEISGGKFISQNCNQAWIEKR